MAESVLKTLGNRACHFVIILSEEGGEDNDDLWTRLEEELNPESKVVWFTGVVCCADTPSFHLPVMPILLLLQQKL